MSILPQAFLASLQDRGALQGLHEWRNPQPVPGFRARRPLDSPPDTAGVVPGPAFAHSGY